MVLDLSMFLLMLVVSQQLSSRSGFLFSFVNLFISMYSIFKILFVGMLV